VESNVTSGVSDSKSQNSEAWERLKSNIYDQVTEYLVSSKEEKTLSVAAVICVSTESWWLPYLFIIIRSTISYFRCHANSIIWIYIQIKDLKW